MSPLTSPRWNYAYTVAVAATSTASSRPTPVGVTALRLVSSVDCWVAINKSPTADTTNSVFLPARYVSHVGVTQTDVVAVIADNPAFLGTLSITELTR